MKPKKKIYTTRQVGVMLYVTLPTIISWIEAGHIKAFKTVGGHRRVFEKDLLDFIKKFKYPMPDELKNKRS